MIFRRAPWQFAFSLLLTTAAVASADGPLAPARAFPKIQQHALYFSSVQEDLQWFNSQVGLPNQDRRTLFLRIYRSVTQEMVNMFAENKFENPDWVHRVLVKYSSLYKDALDCEISKSCPVSPAWRSAFDENYSGNRPASIQLIMAINAHINRDLPIALAESGAQFDDASYRRDYAVIAQIFSRRASELIRLLKEYETCNLTSTDEKITNEAIKIATGMTRRTSWMYGRKLSEVQSDAQEEAVMDEIERNVRILNKMIVAIVPGPEYLMCR